LIGKEYYRHVTGRQYQVWLFSSFDSAGKQFSHFWSILPFEYYVGLLLALMGLFVSLFKSRTVGLFTLITFLFTLFYSINYDIHDIDSYFLLAFVMVAFFTAFGALKILEMKSIQQNFAVIILAV
jgi:hypothetical protein